MLTANPLRLDGSFYCKPFSVNGFKTHLSVMCAWWNGTGMSKARVNKLKKYLCTFHEFFFNNNPARQSNWIVGENLKTVAKVMPRVVPKGGEKKTASRKRSIMYTNRAFPSRFRLSWQSVDVSNKSCQFISPRSRYSDWPIFTVRLLADVRPDRSDVFLFSTRQPGLLLTTSESLSVWRQSVEELSAHCADGWERRKQIEQSQRGFSRATSGKTEEVELMIHYVDSAICLRPCFQLRIPDKWKNPLEAHPLSFPYF